MRKSGDKGGVEASLGSNRGWRTRDFKPNFSSIHLQAQIKIITLYHVRVWVSNKMMTKGRENISHLSQPYSWLNCVLKASIYSQLFWHQNCVVNNLLWYGYYCFWYLLRSLSPELNDGAPKIKQFDNCFRYCKLHTYRPNSFEKNREAVCNIPWQAFLAAIAKKSSKRSYRIIIF